MDGASAIDSPDPTDGLSPQAFVQRVTQSQNLADELPQEELDKIARQCLDDYDMDKASMADWFTRMERGLKLAKLMKDDKNYPYDNASNIKYPLITSAALQFNARAYPAIVPADDVVKAVTYGSDPQGLKAARGTRVATYMSYQLTTKIDEWEEETDRLLLQLPIVGTMVRKWWIDPIARRARCRLIEPGKFIINDKVKNLGDAPRCSEELPLFPVEIETRIRTGQFTRFQYEPTDEDDQGPQDFIEQHTRIDLDDDGYPEPYIVTIHCDKRKVVRMVADFAPEDVAYKQVPQTQTTQGMDPATGYPVMVPQQVMVPTDIVQITRGSYFVAYQFWPSLDGGFHGTGLGLLLGDISDTINTIFNMLIDAGHYAAMGGGFIGSEFRIKGGNARFRPGEWKQVQAQGGDIRSAMVQMTYPAPNQTLFEMLGMLIEAGREISSTKDIMTGDSGGKVQTATTTMALIEQGMMVFTAAYKRIFRALKQEYRMLAKINVQTVDPQEYNAFQDGQQQYDPAKDFDTSDMDVAPVADPRSVTKMQQAAKAEFLMGLAKEGLVNPVAAADRSMSAMGIENTDELKPQDDGSAQMMKQMQMDMAHAELVLTRAKVMLTMAQAEAQGAAAAKDLAGADAQAATTSLDAIRVMLQHESDNLDRAISMGGMAGASGNGGAPGGGGQVAGGPAG